MGYWIRKDPGWPLKSESIFIRICAEACKDTWHTTKTCLNDHRGAIEIAIMKLVNIIELTR